MSQTFTLPQPPDPVKAQQYAGQIRTLIALLAGAGVIGGAWIGVSQEQLVSLVTVAMTLASLVGAAWAATWAAWAAADAAAGAVDIDLVDIAHKSCDDIKGVKKQ